ncbi:uncharacterized protein [Leptinotarsa decemlineata]|uniref:uncharacterized protein n=1 Tax=Leptinotarsa decemlineata TaxID=7539 RepID=UPI003D3078AB
MDIMFKICEEEGVDLVIMSEPNKKKVAEGGWLVDTKTDVLIKVINNKMKVRKTGVGPGYVWIELDSLVLYSCYIAPNIDMVSFQTYLNTLRSDMKKHVKQIVVGGDFNSKSYLWGSNVEDKRGQALSEWMAEDDLKVHNTGEEPTFVRGRAESHIDVTFSAKTYRTGEF